MERDSNAVGRFERRANPEDERATRLAPCSSIIMYERIYGKPTSNKYVGAVESATMRTIARKVILALGLEEAL
jgi:hypothetical protein